MGIFEQYFLEPILQNGWFNPVNTLVYAVVLVVAVFLVFKLLFRAGIRIDRFFLYAILPFIFWGSSTRVLHDAAFAGMLSPGLNAFYNMPVFPTPGSYFITFTFALLALFFSLGLLKVFRIPYWKTMLAVGTAASLLNIAILPWSSLTPFLLVAGLVALSSGLVYGLSRILKKTPVGRALSISNQFILGAHFIDASATFISLSLYGYLEQHVLPRFTIAFGGPVTMFFLKFFVVVPVLWVIDTYTEDRNFRNFLKIVVLILGLAPGLRDLLRLMVGV